LRKIIAIAAVAVSLFALSGCAPSNEADRISAGTKQVCKNYVGGENVDQIKVSTDMTKAPKVSFPTPITSTKIETKVVVEGTGTKFLGNQSVSIEYSGFNGATGKQILASNYDGTNTTAEFLKSGGLPDFCSALGGVREGSRVVMLFPAKLAHNNAGVPASGVGKKDSIIFIFDLKSVSLAQAVGDTQLPQSGFPTVTLTPDGTPGLTFPKTPAPAEFKVATLIKGRGAKVKQDQLITLNYTGFVWDGKTFFDSSWSSGQPAQFKLSKGQLIPGFIKALVGQTVGSQVIAIIPPADGYGSQEQSLIPANSTLVFVVDILAAK